jgi:hypothetical protein
MSGKFMINDIFGGSLGTAAAASSAAAFPALLAMANTSGRLSWGPISDAIGCSRTLALFGIAVPALLLCPYAAGLSCAAATWHRSGRLAHALTSGLREGLGEVGSGRRPRLDLSDGGPLFRYAEPETAHTLFRGAAAATCVVFAGAPVMLAPVAAEVFGHASASLVYRRLWVMVPSANVLGTTILSVSRDHACVGAATALKYAPR